MSGLVQDSVVLFFPSSLHYERHAHKNATNIPTEAISFVSSEVQINRNYKQILWKFEGTAVLL